MAKNLTIYFPPSNFKGPTATQKWGKERGKKHNRKILVCGALRRGQRKMWLSNRQICFPYAHSVGKSNTSSRKKLDKDDCDFQFSLCHEILIDLAWTGISPHTLSRLLFSGVLQTSEQPFSWGLLWYSHKSLCVLVLSYLNSEYH